MNVSLNYYPTILLYAEDEIFRYIDTNLHISLPKYKFQAVNAFGPSFLQFIDSVVHEIYLMHGQDHKSL